MDLTIRPLTIEHLDFADELRAIAGHMPWTRGGSDERRTIIRLKNVSSIGPIANDKTDRLGRACAWTQRQGYTTIDKLRTAKYTSEL